MKRSVRKMRRTWAIVAAALLIVAGCGGWEYQEEIVYRTEVMSVAQKSQFAGGLNDSNNIMDVRTDQLSAVNNMIPDSPRSIVKRSGFGVYPTTQSIANRCTGLGELATRSQGVFQIGLFGDGKAYYVNQNAWTAISGATGLNASNPWSMAKVEDGGFDALALTNFIDVPKKWGFAAATTVLEDCESATWTEAEPATADTLNSTTKTEGSYGISMGAAAEGTLDNCETDDWTETKGTLSLSTAQVKEGTYSLAFSATTPGDDYIFQKTISTKNLTDTTRYVYMWLYIDSSVTGDLQTTNAVRLRVGTDSSNYYSKDYDAAALSSGWNLLGGLLSGWGTTNSPDPTDIQHLYIRVNVDNVTAANMFFMDNWIYMENSLFSYSKTITSGNATSKDAYVDVYIADTTELDSTTALTVYIGSDIAGNAYYKKTYTRAQLSNGWNTLGGAVPAGWTTVGSPTITALDEGKIEFTSAVGPITHGRLVMDNWRLTATGGSVPTWANLGGTPPRARYIAYFHGYTWLLNGKDNSDNTLLYPHLGYRSDTLGDPDSVTGTNSYDFYDEITGAVVSNNLLVVFTKTGIHEVRYTGNAGLPFTKRQVSSTYGAYHRTVQAVGNQVVFAYHGGIYVYNPGTGGNPQKLGGDDIDNNYDTEVIVAGKQDGLYSVYVPTTQQYWLAVGDTGANDKIFVYDQNTYGSGWFVFTSAITGFDVSALATMQDVNGVVVPVIGLNTGQVVRYGEHLSQYTDEEQNGTDIDVTALMATDALDWNNPQIWKRILGGNIKGYQTSSSTITLKVYPDGATSGTTLGSGIDLTTSDNWKNVRFNVSGGAQLGYAFRIELSETGGASADTRWRIDNIGYEALMLGLH